MNIAIGICSLLFIGIYSASIENYHTRHLYLQSKSSKEELLASFWREKANNELKSKTDQKLNENVAKNVIMFLGDGMSTPTLAAARMLLGGEEQKLSFEKFPYVGLSKTYCVNVQTPDSACTATAYLCGVKTNIGTIGVTANVVQGNCSAMADAKNHVTSIAQWAQEAGKATGIVTTTRITHASPAGTYAHTANRDWESDNDVVKGNADPKMCPDIAEQLINSNPGKNFKVILGCGRKHFLPKDETDEEGDRGKRTDNKNLIDLWKEERGERSNAQYVWNKRQLETIDGKKTDFLLGLFESDHCKYHLDVVAEKKEDMEPTLTDMVEKALEILSKEKNGYFLFVEGGRIDHAHHSTKPRKALDETLEFSKAIELAVSKTNEKDTLIVVTSDHAHTMTMTGYPKRGNDIFSVAGNGEDGLPLATLTYANGPGYSKHVNNQGGRENYLEVANTKDKDFASPTLAPLASETHGGDDVGVFALGPWAHLFTGNYEQNTIPHLMAYASCLGKGLHVDACSK